MGDAESLAEGCVSFELARRDEFLNAYFFGRGLEVLAEGNDVDRKSCKLSEGLFYLQGGFAKAKHESCLDIGGGLRAFGVCEDG
jgi:hypothetical protein